MRTFARYALALWVVTAVGLALAAASARAAELKIAVAANFVATFDALAPRFAAVSGHHAVMVAGATGKLFAQIENGAPFDVFLAADERAPARLEAAGSTLPGTRIPYAVGRLALWSPEPGLVDAEGKVLANGAAFRHLALANPKLAPYGAAAVEVLTRLGLVEATRAKWVEGENIAQTREFVASGNAELGFVAWSQVIDPKRPEARIAGSAWLVPLSLHAPLRQDAVALRRTTEPDAARVFIRFLGGAEAQAIVRAFGYASPAPAAAPTSSRGKAPSVPVAPVRAAPVPTPAAPAKSAAPARAPAPAAAAPATVQGTGPR